uniref:Uncharacterized protein n=1 Tax=Onchocerca volvulus TaxID=6282 RepID=A0A8R1XSI4_ONCVO
MKEELSDKFETIETFHFDVSYSLGNMKSLTSMNSLSDDDNNDGNDDDDDDDDVDVDVDDVDDVDDAVKVYKRWISIYSNEHNSFWHILRYINGMTGTMLWLVQSNHILLAGSD